AGTETADVQPPVPPRAVTALTGPAGAELAHSNGTGSATANSGRGAALLAVSGLTVRYGGVVAVNDLSFTVPEGALTGLIGPNGAGKTTTMDAICGFADCGGTIDLSGRRLHGLLPHRRAALGLGRTFQGTGLYEDLPVGENGVVGQ